MEERQARHILGLDLVRFGAALMVMTFHFDHDNRQIPGSWTGWVGVETFFVLSGFVIAFSAYNSSPSEYWRSRVIRLMPAVWICGTLTAMVLALEGIYSDLPARYLATLVLWPAGPWVDGVYWTLPVEISFYALVLVALCVGAQSLSVFFTAAALIIAAYWFARSLLQLFPHLSPVAVVIDSFPEAAEKLLMLHYGSYFALGGFIWLCLLQSANRWRVGLIGLCLATGAVQIIFAASVWAPSGQKLVSVVMWLVSVALIVLSVLYNESAWRVFGPYARAFRLIGLATYPLYLLHDAIGEFLNKVSVPIWLTAVFMIFLSFVVAAFVEPPAQNWLRGFLRARNLSRSEPQ